MTEARNISSIRRIAPIVMPIVVVLLGAAAASAQEKKPSAPKAAPKAAPAGHGAPAARGGAAGHGPTTGGRGPTTAGHGPTTAGRAGGARAGAARGTAGRAGGGARAGAGRSAMRGPEPRGSHTMQARNGAEIRTRADGSRADLHDPRRGMDVHHGLNGDRRVRVERADHSRIVAERGGHGYVQHPYMYHGHEFAHRTYYYNGRAYDRFYRRYPYRGMYLEGYAPAFYFRPAFYGWAYNPWAVPIAYSWGFAANPWYGYYGFYFNPYPVYPSASLWLTDYLISQSLATAYAAQVQANAIAAAQAQAAAAPPPGAGPLDDQTKQLIAAEVQRQIALENQEAQLQAQHQEPDPASSGIARMLSDNIQHVFVAGSSIDVVDTTGTECAVSEGDALQLSGPPPPSSSTANLVMLSSKGGIECRRGAVVVVTLDDLQNMQNHMRETISQGMSNLQSNQSQNGLPAIPPSANAPPAKTEFAAIAPPPDPNAETQINQQLQEADKAEQEAGGGVQSGPSDSAGMASAAPAGPPKTIELGQTIDQVTAILGQPKNVVDLGTKKIYVYPDMKITFNAGKVSDVQ